jgi:Ribonuclease G/E
MEKCEYCYSLITYLNGECPVCGGTGYVKVEEPEAVALWERKLELPEFNLEHL